MLSLEKAMSLVQLKKQQWAREREEMSQFYVPWGADSRLQIRNQFASTLELHKQSSYEYQEGTQRQRSPSLPPIRSGEAPGSHRSREALNRNIGSEKRFVFYDEDGEGDTSGYGSETVHHLNKGKHHHSHGAIDGASPPDRNPLVAWQTNASDSIKSGCGMEQFTSPPHPDHGAWSALGPRQGGGGGGEEGRLRWGDRGVATGRLWEPQDPTARLPQMQIHKKGTPSWVERGLNLLDNNAAEVLVIDQQSTHSGGLEYDRSSCNGSDGGRNTFLRGQNVPIEPEVKAQRETKRMKALELQTAILNQLEEREKQRRDERERKIREERLEELRIQRQQEEDRQKLSEERRKNEEKQETEQRKMEALKKAIEDAEKRAKLEKERMYTNHKYPSETNVHADTLSLNSGTALKTPEKGENNNLNENHDQNHKISPRKQLSARTCDANSPQARNLKSSEAPPPNSSGVSAGGVHTPRSPSTSNVNLYLHGISTMSLSDAQLGLVPIGITPDLISPMVHTQNAFQLAVLVPHNTNSMYNLSQPLSLQSLNSVVQIDETSQTGKLLTPRKYRNPKSRDASTQTDSQLQRKNSNKSIEPDKNVDKDYENIDENAPHEGSNTKKERRFRSEERYNKKDIETRPKWGVNRPAAQYKKQSEKDPFYSQKRKIRQKYRSQPRQYLSHSSEESRSPSPPTQSETFLDTKSRISLSQSHWRNKRSSQELFRPSNMSVETVNISPLEYNHLGQVSLGEEITEEKHIMPNVKMSPSKRITLSQKFINDKYGNRKLWNDATEEPFTERNYKSNYMDLEASRDRKKMLDRLNTARRDGIESEDQDLVLQRTKLQN